MDDQRVRLGQRYRSRRLDSASGHRSRVIRAEQVREVEVGYERNLWTLEENEPTRF